MKARNILCSVAAVLALSLVAGCETEKGEGKEKKESEAQLMQQAKISKADAENIALAQAPGGTIKEGELEKENGKLIWSFDIAKPNTKDITEVNVDAITGKVVGVDVESPKAEAKEAKAEAKEKKEKDDDEKEEKK